MPVPLTSKSWNAPIDVYMTETPNQSYDVIATVRVEFQKKKFLHPTIHDALPFLKKEARRVGADAIMDIEVSESKTGWTRIFRAQANAIKYK